MCLVRFRGGGAPLGNGMYRKRFHLGFWSVAREPDQDWSVLIVVLFRFKH